LNLQRYRKITDLLARATVCALFTFLCVNLFRGFLRTGHVTGLLLLVSELLVVVLTFLRRPARLVDRSLWAGLLTTTSVVCPLLLFASNGHGLLPDAATASMSAAGLTLVIFGKLVLGRSFGLVPANRGVVVAGPYAIVRHPIYSGYLITHAAFFLANPTVWNTVLVLMADTSLIFRALVEEHVLERDSRYRAYCRRVAWHFVPGLF
jgi:protein-S-isoprenylcysteine O-methyltransferase Ste14